MDSLAPKRAEAEFTAVLSALEDLDMGDAGSMDEQSEETSEQERTQRDYQPKPLGEGHYEVKAGDCLSRIADQTGHLWETLWHHPKNQALKAQRQDPNVLLPGDRVWIPPIRRKAFSCQTGKSHTFRLKGRVEPLRVCLLDKANQPIADAPYELEVEDSRFKGVTSALGEVTEVVPVSAKRGTLRLINSGEVLELELGGLDPISELSGVQDRLTNLGFDAGQCGGEWSAQTQDAVGAFQESSGLKVTGELDDETLEKLKEDYGDDAAE